MDIVKEISAILEKALPNTIEISKIEMWGPEVALFTKTPQRFFESENYVAKTAFELKKRVNIRTDKSMLAEPEEAKKKIEKRTDKMVKAGLIKEVKNLIKTYNKKLPAFDAIGYHEIIDYLDSKFSLKEAVEKIKKNTWQFAKRQMTWFKKDNRIKWIKTQKEAEKLVKTFLENK